MKLQYILLGCFLLGLSGVARSGIRLPHVLGDNMVLQRQTPVAVWGIADPGEKVDVTFADQHVSTSADAQGHWQVKLAAMEASDQPRSMTIAGSNTIELKNVLVGEVWLGSGQSNMQYPMKRWRKPTRGALAGARDVMPGDIASSANPNIRLFLVRNDVKGPDVATDGWQACDPKTLPQFSAVEYYFGRELNQKLNVPIGLIDSAWGGTRIEPWTPTRNQVPDFTTTRPALGKAVTRDLFNGMIAPLVPFTIRGAIWYQGEANVNHPREYAGQMKNLILAWRKAWGEGDFSFYLVQVAPYRYSAKEDLPLLWEAQGKTLAVPNTGLAATNDLVHDLRDIHPVDKWDVGHRLALWALSHDYGQKDLVCAGPAYSRADVHGDTVTVEFANAGSGLTTSDGKAPDDFELAGADHVYYPATAKLDGGSVDLTSPQVPRPLTARFAWNEGATPNLRNKEGLPAYPFRTDGPAGEAN